MRKRLRQLLRRESWRPGMHAHDSRRLRRLVLGSLLCLAILLALLLQRVYTHLQREVVYQYRTAAEDVVYRLNQRLTEVLQSEEERAFDDYSFLKVETNPLLQGSSVTTSPLSALPPRSVVPGVIGYFQLNPDGRVQSPVLPELSGNELAANATRFGFGEAELARRLALRRQLEGLLFQAPSKDEEADSRQEHRDAKAPAAASAAVADFLQKAAPAKKLAETKSSLSRSSRKEQVAIPEQSTALQVQGALERFATRSPAASTTSSDKAGTPAEPEAQPRRQGAVKILTFESEVDPLQLAILASGELVFFRKAWRNNVRYVQGFAVDRNDFFQQLAESSISGAMLSQQAMLSLQYRGTSLYSWQPGYRALFSAGTDTPRPIYRATLEAPLDMVEVVLSVSSLPRSASAMIVDLLALALALVLLGGHYGLYRLGQQHIALAAQRSDFVSAVSHELKTPLTSIRMYGEMLREGWITDDTRRQSYYDFIFFESERLSRLITNVLQLARLTNHDAPLPLKEYSLHQLIDLVRSKIATQVEAANFTLRLVEPEEAQAAEAYMALADEDAFVQIFINLVDNALKFSAEAEVKHIEVGLRLALLRSPQAVFFVRDYGPGVLPEQMQRIFQLFYRGENELTRHTKGTGIGLALVKALATKMHGRVEVQNHHPGAEFRLLLPLIGKDVRS